MTTIYIFLCKTLTIACHIFGKLIGKQGTVFPGRVINHFNSRVLYKLKYPKYVIGVTGSSGKGSTVNMAAHIFKEAGLKVVWNNSGSNVRNGLTTLILNNTNMFTKKVKADVVLLEMDERYIDGLFKSGTLTHLLITNVTRDQPARNIHPEVIFEKIMSSIDDKVTLIINADDPILNRVKFLHKGQIICYGISKNKYSFTDTPSYAVDAAYCPKCHAKLKYTIYHYGHLGIYSCPKCDFERGKPKYEATDLDLNNGTFKINKEKYKLNKNVFFAAYYTLAAYVIAMEAGVKKDAIDRAINIDTPVSKRMKEYTLDGRTIEMLESKNENSLSYLQSLNYIKNQMGKKTVIMGFENVSRRYKFNDLSWLWDVNFELLNDENIDKIFLIGRFKYDVATRLFYANIPSDKLVLVDNLSDVWNMVKKDSQGNIYTMVCFDMTAVLKKLLKEVQDENKDN